nr:hypothetical protein [Tanacetum cinerariifolium]
MSGLASLASRKGESYLRMGDAVGINDVVVGMKYEVSSGDDFVFEVEVESGDVEVGDAVGINDVVVGMKYEVSSGDDFVFEVEVESGDVEGFLFMKMGTNKDERYLGKHFVWTFVIERFARESVYE